MPGDQHSQCGGRNRCWRALRAKNGDLPEYDAFDALWVDEVYAIQNKWRIHGCSPVERDLVKVEIVPPILHTLKLNDEDKAELARISARQLETKLMKAPTVDADALIARMMPGLQSEDLRELASALLLATGRRFIEIMKTASFVRKGDYSVTFSGQVKTGTADERSYDIDLLAPASMVIDGLARLRKMAPTEELPNPVVNNKYLMKL